MRKERVLKDMVVREVFTKGVSDSSERRESSTPR